MYVGMYVRTHAHLILLFNCCFRQISHGEQAVKLKLHNQRVHKKLATIKSKQIVFITRHNSNDNYN